MHIILVDNFFMPEAGDLGRLDIHPHLGLTSLASVAIGRGHEVSIFDPKREVRFGQLLYDESLYAAAAAHILRMAPDAVGFTSLACSFLFAVNVAFEIKRREPDLPILLGGPHATMLHCQILEQFSQFDVVVRYEAEETFPQVLSLLETRKFHGIEGVTWRTVRGNIEATAGSPKIENLDGLPFPSYDLYPVEALPLSLMRVEAGRGCPFACTFCSTATFFQRDYRIKSATRLVQEMNFLATRYGATEFKLDHDLFTVNRRKVLGFCGAVAGTGFRWRVSARTDCVDEELLERMAAAGCIGLYFGIESGSAKIQQTSQKRLNLENVFSVLDVAERLSIETTVSFITGYPEEDSQDQAATLDLLGQCFTRPQRWCTPQLHILVPEPGTLMFQRHGNELRYDGYTTKFNARLMADADEALLLSAPEIFCSYFYYHGLMTRDEHTFAVDAVDLMRTVGHDILGYALRFFGHRLSILIREFRMWRSCADTTRQLGAQSLLDFLVSKFGQGHHIVSLFRYGFEVRPASPSATPSPARVKKFDPDRPYELSSHVHIFRDLHDCMSLLERIRTLSRDAPGLTESEVGQPACYLINVASDRATHYITDDGLADILGLFTTARSAAEVRIIIREIAGIETIDTGMFEQFVDIGVLVESHGVVGRLVA